MFKLSGVRALDIRKLSILFDDSLVNQVSHLQGTSQQVRHGVRYPDTHPKMVAFDAKTLEVSAIKDNRAEIGVDGLEEGFCGCKAQVGAGHILVPSVSVDSSLFEVSKWNDIRTSSF